MARLVVERGNEKGLSLSLDPPITSVVAGRLRSCALVLTDALASRQHFCITRYGDHYAIADLQSHNGTFVNGHRINGEVDLPLGATIRAGETLMSLRCDTLPLDGALAGMKLGGYHLLMRIGSGGMGEVYKAYQTSLGRQVAIKILSPELTKDRSFVERFLSEARAAGKFNHPNVIQVHEVGEESGTYYYCMEYVDGGSVQDLVARGRKLDQLRATQIILQAARALEYAEKAGIVHCDVKPDNLMLTSDGDVRLSDLGIAKTLNRQGKVVQSEGVFGSPHYMAPEQARGLPIDHRADLYSLGCTYYRILLGRVPFNGKDAKEIMEKQVFDSPEPPRHIDPQLAPMIYTILAKLLKKRPANRYQSASALIKDLETAISQIHAGIQGAPHPTTPGKGRRPGRFWGLGG